MMCLASEALPEWAWQIVEEVCTKFKVSPQEALGRNITKRAYMTRHTIWLTIHAMRPDLSSEQTARMFGCESSTIRHVWSKEAHGGPRKRNRYLKDEPTWTK